MTTDLNVLTGGQNAAKAASSAGGKTSDSKTADGQKADFGRELAQSQAARRDTTKPSAEATNNAKNGPKQPQAKAGEATDRQADATTKSRPDTAETAASSRHDKPAGDDQKNADATQLSRKWLLRMAQDSAASKTAQASAQATAKTGAASPAGSASQSKPDTAGQATLVRATTPEGNGEARPAAGHAKADKSNKTADDGSASEDQTSEASLASAALNLSAHIPAAARAATGTGKAGNERGDTVELGNRGHSKGQAQTALAQLLARADGSASTDSDSAAAGKGQTGAHGLDTLTRQQTDALARLADRGSNSGFAQAQAQANTDASTASNATSTPFPSPTVGSQNGPNAAIAGGLAGQAAGAATNPGIGAALGSDGWNSALGQHTLRLASGGQQQAQIQLHPRELGQINISVTVNDHNQAQLHLMSPNAHVRDAIEAALPQLRQSLAAGGLTLGQASVGDQGSQAGFGDTGAQGESGRGGQSSDSGPTIEAIGDIEPTPSAGLLAGLRGGIDIFA
ncbi:flagellar hook-length control protein FliK [Salinisphaera sp. SPP-AMP-43]|uniref:flagellar hook-length control protein FliK n=1 Tax=Salinisphaera sp. SPP-AMP-43 TaxID=3121288 RepID=UPI003C6E1A6F